MTRRRKLDAWLSANEAGLARRAELPAASGIRPKRKPVASGFQWSLQERLYVPVPLELKCEIMRIAREHVMSQASLGLVIVAAAVKDTTWLSAVLRAAAELADSAARSTEG